MKKRTLIAIIVLLAVITVAMIGTSFYLDLLWFRDLNVESVFWTQKIATWGLRIGAWFFLFAFIFINLRITRREVLRFPNVPLREQVMASGFMRFITPRRLTFLFLGVSAVISLMFSGYAGGYWMEMLLFLNSTPFNVADPVFGADVSFYVFRLPFYRFIYGFLTMSLVLSLILVGAIYLLMNPPFRRNNRWEVPTGAGISHVAVLLAGLFALKTWDYHLQQLELLLSDRGVVFGAGYTDVNANYPVLQVLMVLAALIALIFLVNAFLRRPRLLLYGILVMMGVSLLGGWAYPAAIQSFAVEPSEFSYEKDYLQHNIDFTRKAYGLERFSERRFDPSAELTWDDMLESPGTINNVRLWDYRPLLDTLNELQAIRLYYRFQDVDIDRYNVDGEYRQVMLSARELDKSRLDPGAQTWVNMHLQYTHGYGVTVSPVNEVSSEGLPRYFLGNIPAAGAEELALEQPSIYFGELTDDYVIVNTNTREFHYATADGENVFTEYEGEGGVPINSFLRRLLFALKFGEYRIAVSGEMTDESRILFDRKIHDRVRKLAPFLRYDRDPYIVINEGRLYWIQDAYTVTGHYPYSTPYGGINYIRNSVKVVIDAYNGTVHYYMVEPDEPLVKAYSSIFPDLFKPVEEMPSGLQDHFRYPEDLFDLQSRVITRYHVQDPNVFYTGEDRWAIPQEMYEGGTQPMEPYYTILQLPGYDDPEFVLILPFTPDKRNNMISWMVARADQPNYGKVELFRFPTERVVLGPAQIENRIDQDTDISAQFSLWSQAGSSVIRGNLLVLPIKDSLIYVEPIFLRATGGGLPELSRVIVVFQETVVMENTLEEALVHIFGERGELPSDLDDEDITIPDIPVGEDMAQLVRQAQDAYSEGMELLQEGDWAGYGDKIAELEKILNDLERLTR